MVPSRLTEVFVIRESKITPQQARAKFPGAAEAWEKQTKGDKFDESSPDLSAYGELRATDVNGGTYGWENGSWVCPECGTQPQDPDGPSVQCHICNRGPSDDDVEEL